MKRFNILIIDDDTLFCDAVTMSAPDASIRFFTAHTAASGLSLCRQERMDVVLLDQRLPDRSGAEICPEILAENQQSKIIFTTAYPNIDTAVQAVKTGAFDYLTKPFDIEGLMFILKKALRIAELEHVEEISSWQQDRKKEATVFLGGSEAAGRVRDAVNIAAGTDAPILLTGLTGTGKSFLARCIHFQSQLAKRPFISINCGSLPENLIESELFGHEKGAFTGATKMRRGIFEMADSGTLFLDEIGTLPVHLQVKLLGVLDDGCIQRIGSEKRKQVDVRIITATNLDMEQAIRDKTFREDLFYRLSVLHIHLPPLKERLDDIEVLCEFFLQKSGQGASFFLEANELELLRRYSWPGNIRELKNIIDRAVLIAEDDTLKPSQLLGVLTNRSGMVLNGSFAEENVKKSFTIPVNRIKLKPLVEIERDHIYHVMEQLDQNQTRAAEVLGIARSTLVRKLKHFRKPESQKPESQKIEGYQL